MPGPSMSYPEVCWAGSGGLTTHRACGACMQQRFLTQCSCVRAQVVSYAGRCERFEYAQGEVKFSVDQAMQDK